MIGRMPYRSKQRVHGGGKFKSERQRRYLWATRPGAARKWAHNRKTGKRDWVQTRGFRKSARRARRD
jgi:hypothetical protein